MSAIVWSGRRNQPMAFATGVAAGAVLAVLAFAAWVGWASSDPLTDPGPGRGY